MIAKNKPPRAASFPVVSEDDCEPLLSKQPCNWGMRDNAESFVLAALGRTHQANSVEHTIQKKVYVSNVCILRNFRRDSRLLWKTLSGLLLTWEANVATFTHDLNVDFPSLISTTMKSCLHMTFLKQIVRELLMQSQNDLSILVTRIPLIDENSSLGMLPRTIKRSDGPSVDLITT